MKLLEKILFPILGILTVSITVFSYAIYVAVDDLVMTETDINIDAALTSIDTQLQSAEDIMNSAMNIFYDRNMALTRAFAELIAASPDYWSTEEMARLADEVFGVTELHVIDEDGIIEMGNMLVHRGFDMGSAEQSREFLAILEDPTLEISQDPQLNGSLGDLMQYTGVARKDAKGLVQLGTNMERIRELERSTDAQQVVFQSRIGQSGYSFLIRGGIISVHPDENMINRDISSEEFLTR